MWFTPKVAGTAVEKEPAPFVFDLMDAPEETRAQFVQRMAEDLIRALYTTAKADLLYKRDDVPRVCVQRANQLADALGMPKD